MAASVSQNGRFRAVFLSVIMVLMTQVGYTENMDFSLSFDEENELLETGGSTSNSSSNNLSPSRDNVVATVGEPMAEISWYHDVSPSGGNAGTTTQGNGSTWFVNDKFIHSVNKANNIGTTIGDTFYYVATGGDRQNTSRVIYSYNKSTDTLGEVGTFGTMPTYSGTFSNSRALDFFANAGGILLFDGPGIDNITAYNPATDSSYSIGVSYGVNAQAGDGTGLSILVGDTLYFAGVDSTTSSVGAGLYAYTAGNNTTWLAADINPPSSDANYTVSMTSMPGLYHGFRLIGDTIYFDGAKGHRSPMSSWYDEGHYNGTSGLELFAYNPSNHTSWQVTDIDNRTPVYGSTGAYGTQGNGLAPQCIEYSTSGYKKNCNENTMTVVGDTLFFAGQDGNSGIELWAHDTSNHSTWQVANINTLPPTEVTNFCVGPNAAVYGVLDMSHIYFSSQPGGFYTIGDTVYFTASNGFYGRELWAYDTSNNSVWQVTRFYRCDDAGYSPTNNELYHFDGENNFNIVGDELFFFRDGGLYIHNDSTQYTKRLWTPNKHHRDSFTEWRTSGAVVMGDTLYGLQLYVSQPRFNYAPTDCPPNSAGGCRMQGSFLYAYDSSNETLYRTAFLPGTGYSSATGGSFHELIIDFGDTILFGGGNQYLYAHQPAEISYPKERVSEASCTISPTLPAGLNFDSNQCTISGTPTAPTSQASYTVTAVINNTTYQGNVLLETSYYPIKASVTGSDAKIGTPIDDITFRIDPTVGISSGSGGNSESSGSDSSNGVVCGVISNSYHTCEGTVRNWYGSDYRSDYGTGLSFDWSSHVFGEAVATNTNFVESASINSAVDSNGHVHIVVIADGGYGYLDTLNYVTNQSGSWQSFVIDDVSSQTMTSIAIDSNDSVHIAYGGYNTSTNIGSLKHATNENGSWVLSIISTAHPHTASSIAIDSQDNPHIAFVENRKYQTYDQGSAHIATNTNGSWTVSTVYTNSTYASASSDDYDSGRHAVLAIDSNDSLHLSWGVEIDGEMVIHYSSNQSGNWSDTVVDRYDSNADLITDSILVDSNDNVHLLHHKSQRYNVFEYTGAITHYTQENGTWTNSTAYHLKCAHGSTSRPADDCEIEAVIDSNDVIHIAYEVEEKNTATQWTSALVKVQYSNNANGYFSPGVDVYPARNVAEMHVHSNGDVDFIYLLENHPNQWAGDKLILTSMNNSELNPSYPMYENNKIATGYNHSCGIIHDNSLVCWGSDYYGQLGDGGTNTDRPYVATYLPVDLGTDRTALAVAAGHAHTCAILDDGSLKCWGDNSHGQLGDGSTTDRTSPVQVDLGAGNTAVAISAGHSHTCAILQDGTLKCWGQDNKGQVGDGGTNSDQSSPVTINLGSGRTADSVSTGVHHTCAVLDDGSIKCWGLNNEGQLGDGSTTNSGTPVSVNLDAGKTAYAVAAGLHHTCAIVDDHVECWGNNDQYQLKQGHSNSYNPDNLVSGQLSPVITANYNDKHMGKLRAISAGYNHTCLVTDYAMNCWGNTTNSMSYYEIGTDSWYEAPWIDEDIGLENETHIAVSSYGNRHCAITSFGKVVCRGYFAEDSNLEYDNYMTSVNHEYTYWYVDNLDAVNVYQWNNTAEAGSATSPNMVSYDDVKYKFSGGGSTTAGQMHTTSSQTMCLVHSTDIHNVASRDFRDPFYYSFYGSDIDQWNHRDGSLVCRGTGYNFGQSELHSRSTSHFVSMDIPEERTVEYISPGNTCAILDDGSLMCWGYNYHGQVGDGTDYSTSGAYYKYSPVYVDLGEGRTAVAVDNNPTSHSCAILDNGAVKCWGRNDDGQLGDGSTTNSATPVSVSLPAGRTAVALAGTCVILDNASVMCWGDGNGGALGNANSAASSTPVYVDLGTNRTPVKIASRGTTCVVFDDGSLTCWGGQSYGETLTLPENYTLPAGRTAFDVAIGEESNAEYVYVHLDDNRVCRKTSYNGDCNYVGYSHLPKSGSSYPYESTDLTAVAISAGDGGLCAVLVNGMLRCTDGQYSYGTYGLLHTYDMVGGFSNTGSGSGGHSSGGMTGISGATCTVSPALPAGLSIDSSTCTISGTPTAVASNTTYTIVATLNNVNYQGTFWLSSSYYELIPSIEGEHLVTNDEMEEIIFQVNASETGGTGGITNVTGATCTVSPALPTGMNLDTSTCTISGTPTIATSNTTYTITAVIDITTYQGSVWFSTAPPATIDSTVEGAALNLGEAMNTITLNYIPQVPSNDPITWEVYPELPEGMSLVNGVISGTPTVYAANQTYTIYANQSGDTTTLDMYFSVDTNNPHTVVESQPIDPIGFHGPFQNGTTTWTVSPDLPADVVMDPNTGEITGSVNGVLANTTYTVTATHGSSGSGSGSGGSGSSIAIAANKLTLAEYHTCAIDANDSLICWGSDNYGQLGDGGDYVDQLSNQSSSVWSPPSIPVDVGAGRYPVSVNTAERHTCAILDNGDLKCWGSDHYGKLGDGGSIDPSTYDASVVVGSPSATPIDLGQGRTAVAVAPGDHHACAILDNGSVKCWGSDENGQLGTGSSHGRISAPINQTVDLGANRTAVAIDSGKQHTCVILDNADMKCWGWNSRGQLGDGTEYSKDTPVSVNLGAGRTAVALDLGDLHTCAILDNGELKCWGFNQFGALGNGGNSNINSPPSSPINLGTGRTAVAVAAGSQHTCAILDNGSVKCWGRDDHGQSGDGGTGLNTNTPSSNPVDLGIGRTAVAIGAGDAHTCAILDNGEMKCWGRHTWGQLGIGTTSSDEQSPVSVSGNIAWNTTTTGSTSSGSGSGSGGSGSGGSTGTGATETFTFSLESLADLDGDGLPNELPSDYDAAEGPTPGLVADTDDDADGVSDIQEEADGTNPLNPDTDGDGMCDGPIAFDPDCVAGPDAFPTDPAGDTDTDGDGKPDTLNPPSNSVPPLEEDFDDDGDGVDDVNETGTGVYVDDTDTGTDPLNPDTDYDGTCDGPVDVYHPQTGDLICVAGPDYDLGNLAVGTHYAVNGSGIQPIRPEFYPTGAVWSVSPDLPAELTINPQTGFISGIAGEVTENITYTITGTGTFSVYNSDFNLQILEDTDRDGEPNELPEDYDDSTVTPMVEDLDDDGDGLSDLAETGTGVYNGTSDYGTDPMNPDTDGDGVCDGPNSVWPICVNGPDSNPFGANDGGNIVLVENVEMDTPIPPPNQVPGAVWEVTPALPAGLSLDTSTGIISGAASEVSDNTTYTLWANVSDFGRSDSVALSISATFTITVLEDSDGDGLPDELPDDYDTSTGTLVEDLDDDNDGLLDTEEASEGTNPLDPDSDGDGFCDGPTDVYADDGTLVCRGPDPAPLDSTLPVDTDGDMFPDEDPDGEGGLVADTDDDGDGFSDELENNCGSDTLDANDNPSDMDGDTICDLLDPDIDGDGLNNTVETNTGIFISDADSGTDPYNPDTDGDGYCDGPVSPNYSNCTAGPDAFPTDASAYLDTDGDGSPDTITGNSTTGLVEDLDDDGDGVFDSVEAGCGTDPLDAAETPELDSEGNCVEKQASAESLFEWSWSWCFCLIFLLLLLLLIPIVMQRDRILVMVGTGPEPENTVSEPEFMEGEGTLENPFILEPSKKIKAGESISSKEVITIDKMTVRNVEMIDLNQEDNGDKFSMYETGFDEIGVRLISVGDDGEITINMHFDDSIGGATYAGGEFTGLLKLGSASVYLSWTVTVKPDKKKLKEIEKAEKEAKKAEEAAAKKLAEEEAAAKKKAEEEAAAAAKKAEEEEAAAKKKAEEEAAALLAEEEAAAAALLAKEEEEKAAKEAEEAEAKKKAEEEAAAKEAEEKAAKEAEEAEAKKKAKEEAAAKKKADAEAKKAKEAEEKAAKEAEAKAKKEAAAKAKAEEEAAAALLAKEEEEKAAKKKAEEEAKAKKKAEEEAAAKKKAEEDAKKAAAAAKPASKEEKKNAELKRVKERSKSIDFKVLGTAKASDKDDLQVIKGIGPFIEEKLNALGIYTYLQISKMTSKLEDTVNEAIEFFPGRVKRDQWVAQAKILLGEDVKLDEKALKKAEELERVAKKAEKIDFGTIGVASASNRDNLQELKGIGPFIEEKLNALGIFKFEQIAKMTSKIEDEVNIAIEFFPGRVKRDEWVKQAKERTK